MDMTEKIVGIAVAVLVAAIVLPIAIDQMGSIEGRTPDENTITLENIALGDGENVHFDNENTLAQDNIIEHTVVISTVIDAENFSFSDKSAPDNVIIIYENGQYDITFPSAPDVDENIYATYDYYTGTYTYWPSGLHTILTVLLPIVAVIAIIIYIAKRSD